ncbi:MAG TPA: hypothetical protein VJB87_01775 [Candidatus Nanoarchaeia archaeon]|nr:hypothetical protein [Candidatus Nanoarchaeia archaeon]
MERKLIKQGQDGYTVYLPKAWIKKKGLQQGDTVSIQETDTALVVTSKVQEKRVGTITVTKDNADQLEVLLTHLYRVGFEKIVLSGVTSSFLPQVKVICQALLLGFEIVHHANNEIVLENITEPTDQKYAVIFRRILLIVEETVKIVSTDIQSGKLNNLKEVDSLRLQVDKYMLFCRRVLARESEVKNTVIEWELLSWVRHVQHALQYTYKFAVKYGMTSDKDLCLLMQLVQEYVLLLVDACVSRDIQKVYRLNVLKKDLHFGKLLDSLKKGKNAVVLSSLREVARLTQLASSPLLSLLLDMK